MKATHIKFKTFFAMFALLTASCISFAEEASSDTDSDGKKTAKVDKQKIKESIKENVAQNDFGDRVIKFVLGDISEKSSKAPNVENLILSLLFYIDPDTDTEKLNDFVSQSLGLKKGEFLDGKTYLVKDMMKGVDRYLASKNMNLRALNFSANNVRNKLDEGLPLYGRIKRSNEVGEIVSRQTKRKEETKPEEWAKKLRKLENKKIQRKSSLVSAALVMGYNKETNEYLLFSEGKYFWISENEFKTLFLNLYQLRI